MDWQALPLTRVYLTRWQDWERQAEFRRQLKEHGVLSSLIFILKKNLAQSYHVWSFLIHKLLMPWRSDEAKGKRKKEKFKDLESFTVLTHNRFCASLLKNKVTWKKYHLLTLSSLANLHRHVSNTGEKWNACSKRCEIAGLHNNEVKFELGNFGYGFL